MSDSAWRADIARSLFQKIENKSGITAFIIGGSVARGLADKYSDLEVCFFWDTPPTTDKRRSIVTSFGGDLLSPIEDVDVVEPYLLEDCINVQGLQVDVWHISKRTEMETIDSVMKGENILLSAINACEVVSSCISVYDPEGFIGQLKEKVVLYPEVLARAIILDNLKFISNGNLKIFLYRKDYTSALSIISGLQKRVYNLLLALNEMYHPTYKYMEHYFTKMKIKPDHIQKRFNDHLCIFSRDVYVDFLCILNETIQLVEKKYSDIDLSGVRKMIAVERAYHSEPIQLDI